MLKKYLILIALLSGVVLVSGCTDSGDQKVNSTNKTHAYIGDEFSFDYPVDWQQIQNTAPNSIIAFGDPKTATANGNVPVSVVIQRTLVPSGSNMQNYYNSTYTGFAAQNLGYRPISEGTVMINGINTLENEYYISSGSMQKHVRAVWIQKGRVVYIILMSAPVKEFPSNQENFNTIISSFKLI